MRCAALFGGSPERGAAGLANDVRRSHVLIGDSCDAVVDGDWGPVLFFPSQAETEGRRQDSPDDSH